jgi:hypothetical protein
MDLREALLEEHAKRQEEKIIPWIGRDKARLMQLINLFLHDNQRVVQRAAWVVSGVAAQHPDLIVPHLPALVKRAQDKGVPDAVKRNVLRLLQFTELPEVIHGDLMNCCFDAVADPAEALAIRAFAMTVLARLTLVYPELTNELKLILEDALQQEQAPSFKNRGKKILQQLNRQTTDRFTKSKT